MGKTKRKPRPQPPKWFWLDTDGCWFCKNRNNCNGCRILKHQQALERERWKRKEERKLRNIEEKIYE